MRAMIKGDEGECRPPTWSRGIATITPAKPLLRGWSHALALIAAAVATVALALRSRGDLLLELSVLAYGSSMIELYAVSAIYHLGSWRGRRRDVLGSLDHVSIFVLIAGTYTPICFNLLAGWPRPAALILIWTLAGIGMVFTLFTRMPRLAVVALYLCMGWLAILAAPSLMHSLPAEAVGLLVGGGLLYTAGALVYLHRRPDPLPRIFGFHEVFHLLVIAGSTAFFVAIWTWVMPLPRS